MKTNTTTNTSILNELSKSEIKELKDFYKANREWESYRDLIFAEILEEYKDNESMTQLINIFSKHRCEYSGKDYIEVHVERVIKRTKYQTTIKPYLITRLKNYMVLFSNECNKSHIIIRNIYEGYVIDLDLDDIKDINIKEEYDGQLYNITFRYDDNVDYHIIVSNYDKV